MLRKFALGNVLLAFDFDGTLAPVTSVPARATLPRRTRNLLQGLTLLYPCIVVSGRSRSDVQQRLQGINFREIFGNHGIEPWDTSRAVAKAVRKWMPVLNARLTPIPGVMVENKQFSVSVHYRKARQKYKTIRAIHQAAKNLPGARLLGGKQVINILFQGAPDKGLAVGKAQKKWRCEKVIFIGDDETDESVFALAQRGRFLTIRVGPKRTSLARFYIRKQLEIDTLLRALLAARETPRTSPRGIKSAGPSPRH
ncbi:MAG: trehalose-phosphatase [Candidatus Acidiferrales bacterium]